MKVRCVEPAGRHGNVPIVSGQVYEARESAAHYYISDGKGTETGYLKERFEVVPDDPSPAAAAVCSECGGAPCECEKEIWTYWRMTLIGPRNVVPGKRAEIVQRRTEWSAEDSRPRGPVQRISDPPHDFGKTSEAPITDGKDSSRKARPALSPSAGIGSEEPAFSSAALARALFDEEMEAEAVERSEYGNRYVAALTPPLVSGDVDAAKRELDRVLDAMWTKTKPDARKRAEALAARVVARMGRKP